MPRGWQPSRSRCRPSRARCHLPLTCPGPLGSRRCGECPRSSSSSRARGVPAAWWSCGRGLRLRGRWGGGQGHGVRVAAGCRVRGATGWGYRGVPSADGGDGWRGRRAAGIPGRRSPRARTPRVTQPHHGHGPRGSGSGEPRTWHRAADRGVAHPTTASGRGRYPPRGPRPAAPRPLLPTVAAAPAPRGAAATPPGAAPPDSADVTAGGGTRPPLSQWGGAGGECPRVTAGCGGAVNDGGSARGRPAARGRAATSRSGDGPHTGVWAPRGPQRCPPPRPPRGPRAAHDYTAHGQCQFSFIALSATEPTGTSRARSAPSRPAPPADTGVPGCTRSQRGTGWLPAQGLAEVRCPE